jgi:heptosyltransferase-2
MSLRSIRQHTAHRLPLTAYPPRILVIKWSALGDVAIASALFEDIRRAYPDAELHLNAQPPWDALFAHDPRFARVFAPDFRKQGWRAWRDWLREVARARYDLIIDLQSNDRSAALIALLWLAGAQAPVRVGNNPSFPYNRHPGKLPRATHALTKMGAALAAAGIPATTKRPVLHVAPECAARVDALLARHGVQPGRFAVFLPGSAPAMPTKRWGAARFATLARLLLPSPSGGGGGGEGLGLDHVVLVGAKDEMDICAAIAEAAPNVVNLCGQTSIPDLVPLAQRAAVIVANDTGPAHVMAASDTPMLAICGPTDPRRVKPLGAHALQAVLPCINCYGKTCANPEPLACMARITPEAVRDAVAALLVGDVPPVSGGCLMRLGDEV